MPVVYPQDQQYNVAVNYPIPAYSRLVGCSPMGCLPGMTNLAWTAQLGSRVWLLAIHVYAYFVQASWPNEASITPITCECPTGVPDDYRTLTGLITQTGDQTNWSWFFHGQQWQADIEVRQLFLTGRRQFGIVLGNSPLSSDQVLAQAVFEVSEG